MAEWSASAVIEAPIDRVDEILLMVREGPVGAGNAPLLGMLPRVGRMPGMSLRGGPDRFELCYGNQPGGTVEVDRKRHWFAMQGGYKFRAEYLFEPHERGTLLTYSVFNVAPGPAHDTALTRVQFWLSGKLSFGVRRIVRRISTVLGCPVHRAP